MPADDAGPDAMLDAQMVDAAVCGGNVCTGNTPVCNMATGLCRACGLAPADCGTGRYCAPSGACVECLTTSQCTTAATRPLCETTTSMCRGCATPGECAAVNSLTPQCKSNGACVGCTASTQCGNGNTPICSTADNCVLCLFNFPQAQEKPKEINELKLNLNDEGSHYIKATFLNQVWLRYNDSNPGTHVLTEPAAQTFDIDLRRTRFQLYGQVTDRVFFYFQFGQNNFNYLSQNAGNRKLQAFFHDALGEYKITRGSEKLILGGGLTIANGLSHFSQPSIGTIMTMDVPVFAQATVDQTDEFSRKLSVYARGQIGKLDYRRQAGVDLRLPGRRPGFSALHHSRNSGDPGRLP